MCFIQMYRAWYRLPPHPRMSARPGRGPHLSCSWPLLSMSLGPHPALWLTPGTAVCSVPVTPALLHMRQPSSQRLSDSLTITQILSGPISKPSDTELLTAACSFSQSVNSAFQEASCFLKVSFTSRERQGMLATRIWRQQQKTGESGKEGPELGEG